MIAGPNGVGKSLIYKHLIAPRHPSLPLVSAQLYAMESLEHFSDEDARISAAQIWADQTRQHHLSRGESFITETVFSHPSRVALLAQARSLGYEVVLYALGVDDPRELLRRIHQRAQTGGPPVAMHKILGRYPRTLENFRRATRLVDRMHLYDAIDIQRGGPRLVATIIEGRLRLHTVLRPRWVEKVLGFTEG